MKTATQKFYGTDVSNEISLLEYGLLVSVNKHEDNSGTQFCIYKITDDAFGCGHISENEVDNLLSGNDWITSKDLDRFYSSFVGCETASIYMQANLAQKLGDLIQYFGTENIFGTDYSPMSEEEVKERYL